MSIDPKIAGLMREAGLLRKGEEKYSAPRAYRLASERLEAQQAQQAQDAKKAADAEVKTQARAKQNVDYTVELSGGYRDGLYTSVMESSGADQFLYWSEGKSEYALRRGTAVLPKSKVIENLEKLAGAEDAPEHLNLKKITEGILKRMEGVSGNDNNFKNSSWTLDENGDYVAKMTTTPLEARSTGRYGELPPEEEERLKAEFDVWNMDNEAHRGRIPPVFNPETGKYEEAPEKLDAVDPADSSWAPVNIKEVWAGEVRLPRYTSSEAEDTDLRALETRATAARARVITESKTNAEAYIRIIEDIADWPQSYWNREDAFQAKSVREQAARDGRAMTPEEKKLVSEGGRKRHQDEARLLRQAQADLDLKRMLFTLMV